VVSGVCWGDGFGLGKVGGGRTHISDARCGAPELVVIVRFVLVRLFGCCHFANQVQGDVGVEDGALAFLLDLNGVDEGVDHEGVGAASLELLHLVEDGEQGVELLGGAMGFGFVGGDLLDAEMKASGVAETGDEGGGIGQGEVEALDGDMAVLGERQTECSDAPDGGECGDIRVEAGEEAGPGEGVDGRAVTVEHGVDLLGGGGVGGLDGVAGDDRYAEETAGARAYGYGVDVVSGVSFFGDGDGGEVLCEAGFVEVADENFGEGDGAIGAVWIGHLVEAEGDGVEVALEEDAGGVDELLVLGGVGDGFGVEVRGEADGAKICVDDAVGLRQETGRAWCGEMAGVEAEAGEDGEEEGGDENRAGAGGDCGAP
jgi:hypothetical protein